MIDNNIQSRQTSYYRARYYDSNVGRFLNEDPIRFGGSVNFYSYADDDPVNLVDPYGYAACCKFKVPKDDGDQNILATVMGEMTDPSFENRKVRCSGRSRSSFTATTSALDSEAFLIVSVIVNQAAHYDRDPGDIARDEGRFRGWWEPDPSGEEMLFDAPFSDENSALCKRALRALGALDRVKRGEVDRRFMSFRGNRYGRRRLRKNETRAAGTDFSPVLR